MANACWFFLDCVIVYTYFKFGKNECKTKTERKSDKGQSMVIAVCKCIGTLTPTIYGTLEENWFILVTGMICFVFDVIYIGALKAVKRR